MKHTLQRLAGRILGYPDDVEDLSALGSSNLEDLEKLSERLARLRNAVERRIRSVQATARPVPEITAHTGERLTASVNESQAPWLALEVNEKSIPGMITKAETQYYLYVGRFYSGRGEVVELGPWLGRSTSYILDALLQNPNFSGRKLHVFDDFIWRSAWMDERAGEQKTMPNHADFRALFDKHTAGLAEHLEVRKRRISTYDGNEDVPPLAWNGRPVEMLYVDCGRTLAANEAWYELFEPHFLPGATMIVMQDWGLHQQVPVRWYNQTKQFTDSKGDALQLVHETLGGSVAMFLYRGSSANR